MKRLVLTDVTKEELAAMNRVINPLIRNSQSIYHILINHSDEITRCEKTIYSYVDKILLDARNIDMPRAVRLRPRKGKKKDAKVDKKCRIGRTHEDFENYLPSPFRKVQKNPTGGCTHIFSEEGIRPE